MQEEESRPRVILPEAKARKLRDALRKKYPDNPINVFAAVNANGVEMLQVQVDDQELERGLTLDINYKAESAVEKLIRNADKRIYAHFWGEE